MCSRQQRLGRIRAHTTLKRSRTRERKSDTSLYTFRPFSALLVILDRLGFLDERRGTVSRRIASSHPSTRRSLVSNIDSSEVEDATPMPLSRDFIGLCIGILSVVVIVMIVALCKWSRCRCLKRNLAGHDPDERFSTLIPPSTPTTHLHSRRPTVQSRRFSSAYPAERHANGTRHSALTPGEHPYGNRRSVDVKAPRVTIKVVPVQSSQQLVPRLSTSPQVSNSSMIHNVYSMK